MQRVAQPVGHTVDNGASRSMAWPRQGGNVEQTKSTPPEIDHWNWGAFGLTWIWGIANRTPAAWLVLVPVAGWIGMPFVLGLKGNAWAWRNRQWPDVATFQRAQRAWAKRALIAWLAALSAAALGAVFMAHVLTSSEAFKLARAQLTSDPAVVEQLGNPIVLGTPRGSLKVKGGGSGEAQLEFSIVGPKARGRAYVSAAQALGSWQLQRSVIELSDGRRLERSPIAARNLDPSGPPR